jgi:uridine monophosphate synthetase
MTDADLTALVTGLADIDAVRFGSFTLKSGASSPVYIDLRLLVSDPPLLAHAARAYARILAPLGFDRLCGLPYAGLPIATAVALETGRPMIYPRREVKEYGRKRAIEGAYAPGETVVVIDDLISDGGSKLEALAPLTEAGLEVRDVVVLIDRQGGGGAVLAAAGLALHSVLTLATVVDVLEQAGRLSAADAEMVREYLAGRAGARQS